MSNISFDSKPNYSNTSLEQLIAEINFHRHKDRKQLFNYEENEFTTNESTKYWTEIFVKYFLCANHERKVNEIDNDDLLFFVRKRVNKFTSKLDIDIEVYRKQNKKIPIGEADIDWKETVYLNLIVHEFDYEITLAICTRTSPKQLQVLKKCSQLVYALPSCRRMDVKADHEELTYPLICFTVDNFEEIFSEILIRDGEMICVELVATDKSKSIQNVLFIGSIQYESLKKVYDARQSSLSSKMAKKITFGLFSNISNQRCEYVRMRGPQGKGFAEMVVTKPKGATVETPSSEPGFSLFSDPLDSDNLYLSDCDTENFPKTHRRRLSDPSSNLDNFFRSSIINKKNSKSESEGLDLWDNIVTEIEAGDLRDDGCCCWSQRSKPKIQFETILNVTESETSCSKPKYKNSLDLTLNKNKQYFKTFPRRKRRISSSSLTNWIPFKLTNDGTKIFYVSDRKNITEIFELGDSFHNPLWTMKGYVQTFHFWKENRRANSVPISSFLTFITLPWWNIINGNLSLGK